MLMQVRHRTNVVPRAPESCCSPQFSNSCQHCLPIRTPRQLYMTCCSWYLLAVVTHVAAFRPAAFAGICWS